MRLKYFNKAMVLLLSGLLLLIVVAPACGGTEPQARTFDLEISEGKLDLDPPVIKVNQDDEVTLRIRSDEEGEVHLHGYDLEVEVMPGMVAELAFTANATGKFDFELHPVHEHDRDSCKAKLPPEAPTPEIRVAASAGEEPGEIHVSVELENFVLEPAPEGTELAVGHWHLYLNGELEAMYGVPEATALVAFPGEYQVMVTLSDTEHCDYYGVQAMTTVMVEEGSAGGAGEEIEGMDREEEERTVLLGSLEVHPR